jgi:hypothetical protein
MKKNDMSARSLEDRRYFLQRLGSAGWNANGWSEAFESDSDVDPEAEATYVGPVFELHLASHADPGYLSFDLIERDGPDVVRLRLYPRESANQLIDRITDAQDTLDTENYPGFIKSLLLLSDPLLIETDDGLHRLT